MDASQPVAQRGVSGHQAEPTEAEREIDEIKHVPCSCYVKGKVAPIASNLDWENPSPT